jgi:hypothetical protein
MNSLYVPGTRTTIKPVYRTTKLERQGVPGQVPVDDIVKSIAGTFPDSRVDRASAAAFTAPVSK